MDQNVKDTYYCDITWYTVIRKIFFHNIWLAFNRNTRSLSIHSKMFGDRSKTFHRILDTSASTFCEAILLRLYTLVWQLSEMFSVRIVNIDHFIKIALYSIDTIVVLSQNLTSFLRLHSLFWFLRHHQHLSRRHYTLTLHKVFYIYLRTMPPKTEIIFAQFMSMRETQILARALKIQNHSDNKIK